MLNREENKPTRSAILLIHCSDKKGLVASVTDFIHINNGNILYLDQHVDSEQNTFFMRVEWDLSGFSIPIEKIGKNFQSSCAERFNMKWSLQFSDKTLRMAIFVSKRAHCLYDILSNIQSGELNVTVPLIISNHADLRPVAEKFEIPYHVLPVTKENKPLREQQLLKLLKERKVTFIVLARYMQILSKEFVKKYPNRIINIHHSFLPAFPGAKPYHSAYRRGVKIIGATSHYVTEELDKGPIIEQDIVRVSHKDTILDLTRKGRELEKTVLSRAIWSHVKHKILVDNNRTFIFD